MEGVDIFQKLSLSKAQFWKNPRLPAQGNFTRPDSLMSKTGRFQPELNFCQNMKVLDLDEIYNFCEEKFFRKWTKFKAELFF